MRPSRRPYRPLVATIAVLSLSSIGLATPAAGAVATGSSPATASVPAAASPSTIPAAADPLVAAAIAKAKAAGKQVLVDQDPRSQRLANPDGTMTSVVSPVPVRYQDGAGAWHDIDLTLAGQLDGSVAARAAVPGPHLARSADGPLHIPTSAGDIIAVHPGASKATAVLSANRASYSRGLGSRDLSESVLVHGVEEGAVLHSAADPASYTVTFTLPVGVTAKSVPNYGVAFDDAAGKQLLAYGGGFTHDANPSTSYPDGAQTDTVTTLVGQSGTTATVNVSFDPGWLADPARVFPVTIDPSYYTNTSSNGDGQDSWVESDSSTSQYASSELRVGYGFGVGGTAVARTLIEFQIAGLANSNNYVTEAHMQINQFASTQCATTYVNGLGAGFSNSTIWSNQPPRDGKPLVSATNLCNGWSSVDLTSVARRWFDNSAPDWGIQMQSNEQSSFGWRKFYSGENGSGYAPAIYVTYDVLPDAPDHLTPAAGTTDTTLTPTLTATAHQSSGNTARLDFQVLPYAGGAAVASGSANNVANGGTGSYTVPANALRGGQHYKWQVRAYDGVGYGPWSADSDLSVSSQACRSASIAGHAVDPYGGTLYTLSQDGITYTQRVASASWTPLASIHRRSCG